MSAIGKINHVVVLMLENRSFDSLFGMLYPKSPDFDGLDGSEANLDPSGVAVKVWAKPGTDKVTMSIPDPDPGELWVDMNQQIFGTQTLPSPLPAATMSGFVRNYAGLAQPNGPAYPGANVMHYFLPEQVPVLSKLARQFAVSDRWHASAPCQTWPNRFFAHTGTANGYENNSPTHFPYDMETIFNRLSDHGVPWKIYFHDMPQTLTLSRLWSHLDRFVLYPEFRHDAQHGTLPAYSFIEPRYFADLALPNDMHPPHIVTLGEQLVADVYNALRSGPKWNETLLIITFDEHGGCYDHVVPPPAVPPGTTPTSPFNFDRYGVRVPAVLVSPYIRQGTVLRPPGATPFDHTSIIHTLRERFSLGPALSARDAAAPLLDDALSLATPDNPGPPNLAPLPYAPKPSEIAEAMSLPLNGMQRGLLDLALHLPATAAVGDLADFMATHADALRAGLVPAVSTVGKDMIDAAATVRRRLATLFATL
jgi:phospholipase C